MPPATFAGFPYFIIFPYSMFTSTKLSLLLCLGLAAGTASAQQALVKRTVSPAELVQRFTKKDAGKAGAARRGTASTIFLPAQMVSYAYDESSAAWVEPVKYTFTFNGAGQETQQTLSDSTTATPLNRLSTSYNADGQVTQELSEIFFDGSWENASRVLTTYDAQKQISSQENQGFERNGTWQTESGVQYQNEYSPANYLTTQTIRGYQTQTKTYVDSLRYQYTLAANGEWTSRVEQGFDNGTWENQERQQNVVWYDFAKGQMASAEIQGWTGRQWQTVARTIGTYTATTTELIIQERVGNAWENLQRQVARYDDKGNLVQAKIEEWDGSAWVVSFIDVQIQLFYNSDSSVRRRITSAVIFGNPLTPLSLDNFSGYRTLVLGTQPRQTPLLATQAYPNPSTDGRFTVSLPTAATAARVQVLDALGRQVATDSWTGSRSSYLLNLSGQRAGVYTVKISTAAGTAVQKLVIQ
jgi:hypothetical protein